MDMGNGTTNHIAFDTAPETMDGYHAKLKSKAVAVTESWNHANSLESQHKAYYDPETDNEMANRATASAGVPRLAEYQSQREQQ
jgi:hypothetical protein